MSEALLEPILRRLRLWRVQPHIPKNSLLLDIGCGTKATFLKAIAPHIKQGFGVDFKVKDLQMGNIQTKQLRFENHLPFADESFEVVTMLAVLEHIEQEREILQEIYRVLIPGGKLILTVPSVWSQPVLEFLAYRLKIVSAAEIRDHKRYYNRQKLHRVLVNLTNFENFHHQYFQLGMNNFCTVVK
ncbi:class I SAM-dependent methyltransferase [Anabaenopsis arnoldii]|uniref:Class I SAM-dependent methyltransferase n=1 Tax=Anabaenopsis arnoldii TaxID=2152938 RepID=A0ABT5ARQ9_9CYAN|nr:class I SAM-dependent methyltransferase [Anabaenopsis arnoldii]MDB9539121.1 class I SAM-dependent methyltransferase [Anabaenopsis arnoldii]MDH6091409.1 class I SAM-dependent methyltransferase [Anabaenopsis arnoldii]